jgi:hypothetical protein
MYGLQQVGLLTWGKRAFRKQRLAFLNYDSLRASQNDLTQVFPSLQFLDSTDCLPGEELTILWQTGLNYEEDSRPLFDSAPCYLIRQFISCS